MAFWNRIEKKPELPTSMTLRQHAAELWKNNRPAAIAGTIAAILVPLALAVAVYAVYDSLKRPADVLNKDVPFVADEGQEANADNNKGVNWPLYGGNPQRTRYLPSTDVKPPYKTDWIFKGRRLLEYSPILVKGTVYGVNNNGLAFSVNAKSGKPNWTAERATLNAAAPAYSDHVLYLTNLQPGQVQALDAKTGKVLWKRPLPGRSESSPLVIGDRVYFGCECGSLFALDKDNGKLIWQTQLGGAVKAAPAFDNGILYVGDYGGTMSAVHASNGDIKWQSGSQGLSFGRAGSFYATAAVGFGRVYAGSIDGRMYSFDQQTGALAWSHTTANYVYAAAAVANTPDTDPTIYFGSYDGTFYALDARDGSERWHQYVGGQISGAGSVVGDTVYVANLRRTDTDGFRLKDGKKVFEFPDGAYNPVISDGKRLYLTGYKQIYALEPISAAQKAELAAKQKRNKAAKGSKSKGGGKK